MTATDVLRERVRPVKNYVRSLTGRHFWLRYGTLAAYRAVCAALMSIGGQTFAGRYGFSVSESIANAENIFGQFKSLAGIERFAGKVADVGAGEGCALGLLFLADGCETMDLVDRFHFPESELQREVNRTIVQKYPQLNGRMGDERFSWQSFVGLKRHSGESAAAETFFENHSGYDYIVSAATLEHVADPVAAIKKMAAALKPGGTMIHGIDFHDHGQFSLWFHALKFLELPDFLYAPLSWQGGPNRVRLGSYTQLLRDLGFAVESHMMREVPLKVVTEVRPYLAKRFRDLPDEDLGTERAMIVARKAA